MQKECSSVAFVLRKMISQFQDIDISCLSGSILRRIRKEKGKNEGDEIDCRNQDTGDQGNPVREKDSVDNRGTKRSKQPKESDDGPLFLIGPFLEKTQQKETGHQKIDEKGKVEQKRRNKPR